MSLVVQKYGGTSVADSTRIKAVARRVAHTKRAGNDVVVVVSAMGKQTDEMIDLANQVSARPPAREMDMLLTAGERISMALLAMALHDEGIPALSLTGTQAGILTDSSHGEAKITEIRGDRVSQGIAADQVVIVAGFQGVNPDSMDVTTLGRGGSDATAVALAAAHSATVCEIYTDVEGVYTADPRIIPDARKLDEISYDEMLELAAGGAGVLMARSVEVGRKFNIPLHVRSSFMEREGTWVKEEVMEEAIISGIAYDTSEAKVTLRGVPDRPGVAATIFQKLADAKVNVDMIVQNVAEDGCTDISFTVPDSHVDSAQATTTQLESELDATGTSVDTDVGKVSLVGAGMRSTLGVAARVFRALGDAGINIEMISTSSIRISCVVAKGVVEDAVRVLHAEFDPPVIAEDVG
ncbi:MAG: aspartate kinase [Acidimicrobiia bacterium]|nr:aspartate kinase [bacterium]MXX64309.1 aspartate kinase [Acidimicrobiia bacterium]MCY3579412.1 aspartate kinase [bacterium]MCY3653399.1 aspartate kinase [bacterium]MDE0644092.1 aspartate kinase [bacterium]